MRGVQSFLVERLPEMFDYIRVVSTPRSEESHQTQSEEARVRSRAVRVLHERKRSMPELHRETIPHLPHFLDIPRHLAIITSSVSRYSRESPLAQDPIVADLISQCNDVEQQALSDVSYQMAPNPVYPLQLAVTKPSLPHILYPWAAPVEYIPRIRVQRLRHPVPSQTTLLCTPALVVLRQGSSHCPKWMCQQKRPL
jgi:hypothetical protein